MRAEKQFLLDEIKEKIDSSKGFIVASYKDFDASKARAFRDQVAEVGGEFEVVRKRVFIKAAQSAGIELDSTLFEGHVGVVFANEDTTRLAKSTVKYSEDNNEAISVLTGQIDGEVVSKEDITALAKLPSLEELRAQIVGLLQAPMAQTVGAMNQALTAVLVCMEEKGKKG